MKNIKILKSKPAMAVYLALAVLIATAFGQKELACKAVAFLDVEIELCDANADSE